MFILYTLSPLFFSYLFYTYYSKKENIQTLKLDDPLKLENINEDLKKLYFKYNNTTLYLKKLIDESDKYEFLLIKDDSVFNESVVNSESENDE